MLKVKKVSIVSLITLMCLLIAPFHVYAFSIDQSTILGTTVSVEDVTVLGDNPLNNTPQQQATKEVNVILRFEVTLENEYLGYLTGNFACRILAYDVNGNTTYVDVNSGSKSYYISGYSLVYYVSQKIYYNVTPSATLNPQLYNPSFTLAGSNVVMIDAVMYYQAFDDILTDISDGVEAYLYDYQNGSVIENVVTANHILSDILVHVDNIDDNTDIISKLRQFDVPIYSYNMVISGFNNLDLYEMGSLQLGYRYFDYPIFLIHPNQRVDIYASFYLPNDVDGLLIYGTSGNLNSITNTVYNIVPAGNGTLNIKKANNLYNWSISNIQTFEMKRIYFTASTNTIRFNIYNNTNNDLYFVPIYFGRGDITFDTEFANIYGLIDTSHTDNLDNSTSDMQTEFNTMFGYEDNFNSDMNNALQNIDVQFNIGNQLGSKFLASADWVRTQFNTLTNSTPFGTVLSFSLLLGLALLIIGKAIK